MAEKRTTTLRKLFASGEVITSIWGATAHHAQLTQALGFPVFGISGSNVSTHLLGLPDAGFLTMTELVDNVQRICRAVEIPVIVDCDTGFGNAINARRTVDSVIRAGAACLFIEDQVAPKRCGFVKGKELISLDEAAGKYRAAADARDEVDPDFMLMARTDARGVAGGSVEEVIRRGRAYLDAGVDIFYAEALQSREEIRQVREALPDCLFMATQYAVKPPLTRAEMRELGLSLTGVHVTRIGSIAMYNFLRDYAQRGEEAYNEFAAEHADHPLSGFGVFDLTGFPRVAEWEERYLPRQPADKYEGSLGVYDPRGRQPVGGKA